MAYTNEQKAACARRELNMREWVYPGRIARGKMTQEHADTEIAIMAEIAEDYARAADRQGRLFAETD